MVLRAVTAYDPGYVVQRQVTLRESMSRCDPAPDTTFEDTW